MQQVVEGNGWVVNFEIKLEDGNFASPDVGSVSYSLRDNAGELVEGATFVPVETVADQTTINVPIGGEFNTLDLETENRTVVLTYAIDGRPYTATQAYMITPFLPFVASSGDVRVLLGVDSTELPDTSVDLVRAYYDLADQTSTADLNASLTAGGRRSMVTNKGIAAQAAIGALPALQISLNQGEKSDVASFTRFSKVDWEALKCTLAGYVADAVGAVTGTDPVPAVFIFLNTPTDPVTGA